MLELPQKWGSLRIILTTWENMNTDLVLMNPDASNNLTLSIKVECNTSDDQIFSNIRTNSANQKNWIKLEEPHKGIAILCGSGPSMADHILEIRAWRMYGAKIFALNGCAGFLNKHGIIPDYQVILDAQKVTVSLIGDATEYLFASQVDPECFEIVPTAQLWQATHGDIALEFPEYEQDYCMVGGAISVGNSALVLSYVMGYREMHCYGYDSSHKDGEGHAFKQSINNGDPTTIVRFNNKEYISSLTMKLQAKYFMERAMALKQEGCTIEVHGIGLLPDMYNARELSEQEKYEMMWNYRDYGDVSPGARNAEFFVKQFNPQGTVIDFGCGSGKGGAKIAELTDCKVIMADFANNCLDQENKKFPFVHFDMRLGRSDLTGDFGFCCDVMEHIPPESVDASINNVMRCVPKAFFQISTVDDNWGTLIGHPLHLSVHSYDWWKSKFEELGYTVEWYGLSEIECYFFITLTT